MKYLTVPRQMESSWVYYTMHFIATITDHSIISQCVKGYISCSLVQAEGQGHLSALFINKQIPIYVYSNHNSKKNIRRMRRRELLKVFMNRETWRQQGMHEPYTPIPRHIFITFHCGNPKIASFIQPRTSAGTCQAMLATHSQSIDNPKLNNHTQDKTSDLPTEMPWSLRHALASVCLRDC